MPIRITGMNSGLDTEGIISELVKGQRAKVDIIKKNQISLQWKQDAWKELNTKALKLFNGTLSKMRFSDAYSKKATKVSNPAAVSVVTGGKAVNGVQELQVKQLAKTGYLTGAKLSENGAYKESSTLSQLAGIGADETLSFSVTTGGKATEINLKGSSKISDVVNQLKSAGLNANFDATNQRLFISSTTTGKDADFALTANNENGFKALSGLGINVYDSSAKTKYESIANTSEAARQKLIDTEVAKQAAAAGKQLDAVNNELTKINDRISTFMTDNEYADEEAVDTAYSSHESRKAELEEQLNNFPADEDLTGEDIENKAALEAELKEVNGKMSAITAHRADVSNAVEGERAKAEIEAKLADDNQAIKESVAKDVDDRIEFAKSVVTNQTGFSTGATRIEGQDAKISLNGAEFTSKNNTFEINGLTLTATQETGDEIITVTTQDDTDGIYDMVKNFIKEYNALINEMDKLYNAASAKDYKPLTDEEKEVMTESEIEKWEAKIKDSILRRDSSVSNVASAMKEAMSTGVSVNGKNMYLSDFGIEALSYFLSPDNEKNAYHISGDEDDAYSASAADKLKGMIANDPATVTEFFTGLTKNLYAKLDSILLTRNDDTGINSLYDDKRMKREYEEYTKKIAAQEAKVTAMEDKYYKQFSAMETALAKLQSSQSAISGLLGG